MPGYLVPSDIERMASALGAIDAREWALRSLLASPGAVIAMTNRTTGETVRASVPTLVPARAASGHCVWFDAEYGRCGIHAAAPFGCAFFDCSMSRQEGDKRSLAGLRAIVEDRQANGLYSQIWDELDRVGRKALSPFECRRKIQVAIERLKRKGRI
jgi:hypothetical protein